MKEALSSSETSVLTRATRRNIPEEPFFNVVNYLIHPTALGPGVYSAYNRNEYQRKIKVMSLGTGERPECEADNPTAICEPSV
jgi:hypothetical protein